MGQIVEHKTALEVLDVNEIRQMIDQRSQKLTFLQNRCEGVFVSIHKEGISCYIGCYVNGSNDQREGGGAGKAAPRSSLSQTNDPGSPVKNLTVYIPWFTRKPASRGCGEEPPPQGMAALSAKRLATIRHDARFQRLWS
jgi:hypothetical protein